jgi:hypothetical protein
MINTQNKEITPCLVRKENAGQGSVGGLVRLFCYPSVRRRTEVCAGSFFRNSVDFSCLSHTPFVSSILRGTFMVVAETDQAIGKLSNSVGEMVEHFAAPDIREQFNDLNSGLSEFLSRCQISLDQPQLFPK